MKTYRQQLSVLVLLCLGWGCLAGVVRAEPSAFAIANTTNAELCGTLAFDGTNCLVGIQEGLADAGPLSAQLVSLSGGLVGSRIPVGASGTLPYVAFDGTNYLMIWSVSYGASDSYIKGQFISPSGSLVGGNFIISHSGTEDASEGLAFDGARYLVVYSRSAALSGYFARFVSAGVVSPIIGDELGISVNGGVQYKSSIQAVAFNGSEYLVVWQQKATFYADAWHVTGGFVSKAGAHTTILQISEGVSSNALASLSVASDGNNFLVAWNHRNDLRGCWEIHGRIVTPTGAFGSAELTLAAPPDGATVPYPVYPFIAFDETGYLVSWTSINSLTNMDIRGRFVSTTGTFLAPFNLTSAAGVQMFSPLCFGGGSYVVAWGDGFKLNGDGSFTNSDVNVQGAVLPPLFGPVWVTITVNSSTNGGGSVTGGGTFVEGSTNGITATASNGWRFTEWNDGNTNAARSIIVPASNITYTASFTYTGLFTPPYTYTTNNGALTITGYTGTNGTVTIPGAIDGLPVTILGDAAFSNCTGLTSVTIPNSVTNIGISAFEACTHLVSVLIGTNVTSIGHFAFNSCSSLTSVTIPGSVTHLGEAAFSACSSLTTITVAASNPAYSSVAGVVFNKNKTTLIQYAAGKAGSYTIPNSVTNIGTEAFYECYRLTGVTIPGSVTRIGDAAFCACVSLASVTVPGSVTDIGYAPFAICTSLGAITVASSNPAYCSVAGVVFNKNRTRLVQYPAGRIGGYTIPGSVTSIADLAFSGCTGLTGVTIPTSVSSIGAYAFSYCSGLLSAMVANGVTSIGDGAFAGCTGLFGIFFLGNAPGVGTDVFLESDHSTVYYLAASTGWSSTFGGRPTALFSAAPQTLTVTANPLAGGSVGGGGTFQAGSNVAISATAAAGWLFAAWNDGNTNASRLINVPLEQITYTAYFVRGIGAAVDAPSLDWTTGGQATWTVQSTTTHDGVAALKSGALGAGQQSWFQTTTNGPGSLLFWWRASSAPTNYLQFYINTQLVSQISGNAGWNQYVGFIGTSNQVTLKWVYTKNGAAGASSDAGWVDQINWMPCPYAEHVPLIFYQDPSGMLASWVIGTNASFQFARILANTGGWALKAAGDVDGDGVSDLLFETTGGATAGWFINADGSIRGALLWPNLGAWEIKACGDYEGLGHGQVFFQHAAGVAAYWRLDTNGNPLASIVLGNMGSWKLRGIGDLDGDGKAELFWQNAAGTVVIWCHNPEGSIRGGTPFNTGNWALCGVADIDGDSICDLVWQNSAGLTGGWFMNSNGTARAASFWWGTGAWKLKAAGR